MPLAYLKVYSHWLKSTALVVMLISCVACSSNMPFGPSSQGSSTIVASSGAYGRLVSRRKPVYCSGDDAGAGGTDAIVSGHYGKWSFWRSSLASLPSWCAIHVGSGPTRLLLAWYCDYVFNYMSDSGLGPQDYTLSVSSDSTNGTDGTWRSLASVVDNHTRDREHVLSFAGQSWVKMTVTKGQPHASQPYIMIDQIDLYDVSTSLNSTFFFSGDSITAIAYNRSDEQQPSFAEDAHTTFPQHFPAMLDGGMGYWSSNDAVQNIDFWLSLNPDMHYWLLEWGTNDALGRVSPEHFRENLQLLVKKITQAKHLPVLAHLPFSSRGDAGLNEEIQSLNAVIDQVTMENKLIPGPDLYQLFQTHAAAYLRSDGIHPTPAGAIAMNLIWFQTLQSYFEH